jgi:imidazolonepropionase-like amidohydrolase
MGNRFKTAIIDDATASHINATHQENLLDLFESAMKSVAVTLIREATFDTTDFGTAKRRDCEGFQLSVKRLNAERTAWTGIFQRGDEQLDVLGHLE